jgi:hypothetical protein
LLDHLPAEVLPKDLGGACDEEDDDLSVEALKKNEAQITDHMDNLKGLGQLK